MLRSFAVAAASSYVVMPGGLTRVGRSSEDALVSNQRGAGSKDTWIVASEPLRQDMAALVGAPGAGAAVGHGAALPSRIAENLFWMGRYAERAESAIRLLRAVFARAVGVVDLPDELTVLLLRSVTAVTATYPGFCDGAWDDLGAVERELLAVILDRTRPGTVCANLAAMLAAAEQVQSVLAADAQRIINGVSDDIGRLHRRLAPGLGAVPDEALAPLVTSLLALAGVGQECMPHGPDWRFLALGRGLERAQQACRSLAALFWPVLGEEHQALVLEVALASMDGLGAYRRLQRGGANMVVGLDLLLLDREHPRSLLFQLQRVEEHLEALAPAPQRYCLGGDQRCLLEARSALQLADLQQLVGGPGPDASLAWREALRDLLDRIRSLLDSAALHVAERHFDHAQSPQLRVATEWEPRS